MQPLALVGPPEADTAVLVGRLAERLAGRGRVGTVTSAGQVADGGDGTVSSPDTGGDGTVSPPDTGETRDTADRNAGVVRTYRIGDGTWQATGDSLALSDALDRLAPDCDYALVEGWPDSRLPTVALGGVDAENVHLRAPDTDSVDLAALVEAVETVEPYETLGSLVARVKRSPDSDRAGAIATFTGRVRTRDGPDDEPTEYLTFEKYDGVADERLSTLRSELEARDGVHEVRLHHRTGVVRAEEDIVFVVVLAGHRPEAFRTVEDGIDRLKEEVPLFKKEVTVSGEFWAHEH